MALSSELNRQTYSALAGQTDFPFTLPFFDATTVSGEKYGDIKVYQEETDGTLTSLVANESPVAGQFKVVTSDPGNGCTVTLGAGASLNDIIVIERDVAYTQEYDLQEGSTIDPSALNKALDRVVAQNQQQNDLFTRTVEFPVTDNNVTYTVGSSTARANKALGFDASGNVTELDIAQEGGFSVDSNEGLSLVSGQLSAKVDSTSTEFSGGNIAVKDAGISVDKLATDAVETVKIKDDNVTYAKIQDITTSNSVLGNTATGEVTERALVGDILIDDDTMSTPSNQKGATQESIKAYVDNSVSPLRPKFITLTGGTRSLSQASTTANYTHTFNISEFAGSGLTTADITGIVVRVHAGGNGYAELAATLPFGGSTTLAKGVGSSGSYSDGTDTTVTIPINAGQTSFSLIGFTSGGSADTSYVIRGAMVYK
jgi:hypothetical protein